MDFALRGEEARELDDAATDALMFVVAPRDARDLHRAAPTRELTPAD